MKKKKKLWNWEKLCYINKDNVIVYIKADDFYKYIVEDVETIWYFNYELERHCLKEKMKN